MSDDKADGCYAPDPIPRWKRWLQQKLFPQTCLAYLEDNEPGFAPGECITGVNVVMCWKDRLRALVSGRLNVEMRLRTDVPLNRIVSRSQFNVTPPRWLDR